MAKISTLLVANRGEIALRIMRTARALGLRSVAVYSDADAHAPHVRYADDAVHIGPSPVGESYLRGEAIIAAAEASGADAIHPGYGFLSENATFARAVEAAGLIFVGPPVRAIEVMGDKARAKRAMIEAGVPCVPGYQGDDQSDDRLIAEAVAVGLPVMVKAAAGGGGRGMRLVRAAADLAASIKLARAEALNAFGSDEMIIEKAILQPRHVEVQVFADAHGGVIHLGERDCSVQRRHQKVIEEAPCPVMTPDLRAAMGSAAVEAARAVDYRGAGTVEFLLDAAGHFYFLEMNTRLQVEHPVTEAITGLDLVALQIQVARGEPLGLTQDQVTLGGHAIEVRLYAEDPGAGFLPSTGPVRLWSPTEQAGVRVDAGIATGGEVSPFYDAMVAKIIVHAATRDIARRKLIRALGDTALFGVRTNRDFLIDALDRPAFAAGEATTAFIGETYGDGGVSNPAPGPEDLAAAAVLQYVLARERARSEALGVPEPLLDWSSAVSVGAAFEYEIGDSLKTLTVRSDGRGGYDVETSDRLDRVVLKSLRVDRAALTVNARGMEVVFWADDLATIHMATPVLTAVLANRAAMLRPAADRGGGGVVIAPMHGRLVEMAVTVGQTVVVGQRLCVLEAMKMQHEIQAEIDGEVTLVASEGNAQVAAGDLILEITPAAA